MNWRLLDDVPFILLSVVLSLRWLNMILNCTYLQLRCYICEYYPVHTVTLILRIQIPLHLIGWIILPLFTNSLLTNCFRRAQPCCKCYSEDSPLLVLRLNFITMFTVARRHTLSWTITHPFIFFLCKPFLMGVRLTKFFHAFSIAVTVLCVLFLYFPIWSLQVCAMWWQDRKAWKEISSRLFQI